MSDAFGALETPDPPPPDAIEGRARELLAELSLDEKIGLMGADTWFWPCPTSPVGGTGNRA